MDRDFFVALAFSTHRVANILPEEGSILAACIKGSANRVLTDLVVIAEENPITLEQKQEIAPRTMQELDSLARHFRQAKDNNWINRDNFLLLEEEYGKIRGLLEGLLQESAAPEPVTLSDDRAEPEPVAQTAEAAPAVLTERERKILELLAYKERAQVWEIQKILPDVTKRTLRRDLDDLLKNSFIERVGEWNAVSYKLKRTLP